MKNLFKTLCVLAMVVVIACKKQDIPAPIITGTNGTNDTTTIIVNNSTDTIKIQDSLKVFYSDWFTPETWIPTQTSGNGNPTSGNGTSTGTQNQSFFFNVHAPLITQTILDKGAVLAYCRLASDGANTRPLPANNTISGVLNIWNYVLSLGNIQFTRYSMNPVSSGGIGHSNYFRYVVIPSNTHLRLQKPLKEMSYEEVCEMFSIPK